MKHLKLLPLVSSILLFSTAVLVTPTTSATRCDAESNEIDPDFGTEVEPEGLNVSVTSSTKTSTGQSFSFQFSTGGQGFGDTTDTYLIAPDDAEFTTYYNEFSKKTIEERKEIQQQHKDGLYETVEFDAYIYSISGREQYKDIVIPRALKRDIFFQLNINSIGGNAISDWTSVTSITIPKEVQTIYSNSFNNVPSDMVFKVEFAEGEIPSTWATDWAHGAKVEYGASIAAKKEYPLSKAGASMYGDETKNFILGWYPEVGTKYPLIAEYKVQKDGVTSNTKYIEFKLNSSVSFYNCVGKQISDYRTELNLDVPTESGEDIIFESIKLHNIFPSTRDENKKIAPDTTVPCAAVPQKLFINTYNIDDFVKFEFTKLSSFSKYTAIDLNLSIATDANIYQTLKPNYYKSHKASIDTGKEYIRYRITSLTICSFKVTYEKDGQIIDTIVPIKTPIIQFVINDSTAAASKTSKVAFLLDNTNICGDLGFKSSDIKALSFESFYITIDIFGEKGPVAKSNASTRFGFLSIMPFTEKAKVFNANSFITIFAITYIVAYAGVTAGLFFYMKNKYKNDEFRRMKPKSFFKKAALGLGGSLIVILMVIFTILRNSVFNNVIVVFNPIDAFIIITGVLSVIIIGYFIKYLVVTGKTIKERKRVIKLRLNEDAADDGTN